MKTPPLRHGVLHGACLMALVALASPAQAQTSTTGSQPAAETTLPEVQVRARRDAQALPPTAAGGLTATGARLGILGNTNTMDTPLSVNAYTKEMIQDFQARTVGDVLQGDPSVWQSTNEGHMFEQFLIRGLTVLGSDAAYNGLYGIAPSGHIPTEFIERVEVLRGPNALLGGVPPSGAVGGMINMVPKRAGAKPITDVTVGYSSKSYAQTHVDIGRRFGDEQRLGVRVNGVYGNGETGVAEQKKGRRFGAIGIDYEGDRYSLSFDAYNSRETIRNGSPAMYSFARLGHLLPPPDGDTNLFKGTHGEYRNHGYMLRGEYRFNDAWTAYAAAGASKADGRGLMFGTRTIVLNDAGNAQGFVYNVTTFADNKTFETGVEGNFRTGSISHRVNVALNYLAHKEGTSNRAITGYAQNIYDPVAPVFPDAPAYPPTTVDDVFTSLALADTLGFLDDTVLLTAGVRIQQIKQKISDYDESRVSPSLGVVYKPWGNDISLYANYMEGLSAGEVVGPGFANENNRFKPLTTKQLEVGTKIKVAGSMHSLALFQIQRPQVITDQATNTRVDGGKQRIRGAEWTVSGNVVPSVSMFGGVSIFDAKQVDRGLEVFSVPDWIARVGAQWNTPLAGVSLNGRFIYTGRQWLDSANTLRLPAWNRFDIGAGYRTRIINTPVAFNAAIENVTDKKYWYGPFNDGFAMQGMPRTLRLSATVSF